MLFAAVVVLAVTGAIIRVVDGTSGMPVGDLPGWKQTGVQDFDAPAAPGRVGDVYGPEMSGYSGFEDSSGKGMYAPDLVLSVADGRLDYFLHSAGGRPQVASVIPFGYEGQKYGRYSIRFRFDPMPGYKIAFLLWPASDNWNDGEIDWPEGPLDGQLYGASAIKGSAAKGAMRFDPPGRTYSSAGPGEWHVATTEWTPGNVSWFMDGELVGQTTVPSGVPDTAMRWTLQAETSDRARRDFPEPAVSGHLQIDWAVQYAYAR